MVLPPPPCTTSEGPEVLGLLPASSMGITRMSGRPRRPAVQLAGGSDRGIAPIDRSIVADVSFEVKQAVELHKRSHVPNHSTTSALPLHAVPAASASSSHNSKRGPFLKLQVCLSGRPPDRRLLPSDAVGFLRQSPGLIPRMSTTGARCRCSWRLHGLHGSPFPTLRPLFVLAQFPSM